MPYGFHGRLIDIDLSNEKIRIKELPEDIYQKFLGGRGLGTWILWNELGAKWDEIDPLGEENLLLILTGPLTGYYPGMKICITGKSPQSNGVVGSTISSEVGIELKAAGYDGIIVRGKANTPVYLFIYDDTIEIRDASKLWGLTGTETIKALMRNVYAELRRREGIRGIPKEPAILYIGPAGENKVRTAAVMSKLAHAAGYGGYGAVMGAKNLKAIVVKGTGPLPPVANFERFKELLRVVWERIFKVGTLRYWGTGAGGYTVGAEKSAEPIRNWQEEYHDDKRIGVLNFEFKYWVKDFWGDYGCPVTCMKLSYIKYGKYKGALTDMPDYELQAYLGTNLGIFSAEKIIYLAWLVDEYGLDAINTGNVLAFAAELYQRGILTKEDLDGIELKWGDADAFASLIKLIVERKGIGAILAEGTYRAAIKLSEIKNTDVLQYAVQVKGIAVGAHGIRSKIDYPGPISYAVSVQGGDHTSTAVKELPARSARGELISAFDDSAVVCSFTTFVLGFEERLDFLNTVTGWNITSEKWINEIGLRIIHLQRLLILLGGPDVYWDPRIHDDNPPRFYEPLPSGPAKGEKVDRNEVVELRKKYYQEMGYDEYGIPREEVLDKLGITNYKTALEKIRKRLGV
ncbi:MAG: aldehyde ferredoxin oxidoreductase family protein [Candidatus Njordarchaeales archaeon]